tara:strand:- start:9524 stop:11011 length:1488 start_codon:yes stop_codon:yes gene_type:complete
MEVSQRIQPFSEEAEGGALGALMLDSARLMPLAERMGMVPDAFSIPAHRLIYAAMMALSARQGAVIDRLTVLEFLKTAEIDEKVGGSGMLDQLCDLCVTAAHGEAYLEVVRSKWAVRKIIDECRAVEQECYQCEDGEKFALTLASRFTGMVEDRQADKSNRERMDFSVGRWRHAADGGGMAIGLHLPWERLTMLMCGLEVGMTILAGRPSQGKTTVEDQIAHFVAMKGIGVGRFTLDSTAEELLERGICRHAGVSLPKLKWGHAGSKQLESCQRASDVIADLPIYLDDTNRELRAICGRAREWKRKYDIGLLTVDFIQLVEASDMGKSQWDANTRVGYVSKTLKALSFELGIPVLVLSQLKRKFVPAGEEEAAPELEDLRDSGSLEQDATKVVFVYADRSRIKKMEKEEKGSSRYKRPTYLHVLKHKNGETGPVPAVMRPHYFLFEDCDDEFEPITEEIEFDASGPVEPVGDPSTYSEKDSDLDMFDDPGEGGGA